MADEFHAGAFRDTPAWHHKGKVVTGGWSSVTEALGDAGLTYLLELHPLTVTVNEVKMEVGKNAIVRVGGGQQPAVIGVVGPNYEVIQPHQMAVALDPLAAVMPLDTIGALGAGGRIFYAFDGGEKEIGGDPHRRYFAVLDDNTGKGSVQVLYAPVRVVCQNTWIAATKTGTGLTLRHTAGVLDLVAFRASLEAAMKEQERVMEEEIDAMMRWTITKDQLAQVIEAAIPDPVPTNALSMFRQAEEAGIVLTDVDRLEAVRDRALQDAELLSTAQERVRKHRLAIAGAYSRFNDEFPRWGGTMYAAMNAVTEYADWGGKLREGHASSVIDGPRAAQKTRAYAQALEIMGS